MSDIIDKAREWAPQLGHYGAHAGGVVMEQCADEIARLRAELAAVRADAERYRKWRADFTSEEDCPMLLVLSNAWTPDEVDATIYAARGGQQ